MPDRKHQNDAKLWAEICDEFYAAGVTSSEARMLHARRVVALVRRHRSEGKARTFAPGDEIPLDVTRCYDLDGDTWVRLSADPASTAKDTWRMPGFDAARHEDAARGCYVTPHLLDKYGPMTELAGG